MLIEQGEVPVAALPLAQFSAHLRMGTGFGSDGLQDEVLESYLRAALAAIEARIGKALFLRRFKWSLSCWRNAGGAQALPLAPVAAVVQVGLTDAAGQNTVLPAATWRLVQDMQRPKLVPVQSSFPPVPHAGQVEVLLDAGFGADWAAIPADLRQAVLLLAAEFYEMRHDGGEGAVGLPGTVQSLIERWRTVRVLGGGAA